MTDRSSHDIVNTPSPLEGKDEHKLEYIKEMLAMAQWSQKHVMLYVTVSLGAVLFFISQIGLPVIRSLPFWGRLIFFIAVFCEVFGALHASCTCGDFT